MSGHMQSQYSAGDPMQVLIHLERSTRAWVKTAWTSARVAALKRIWLVSSNEHFVEELVDDSW